MPLGEDGADLGGGKRKLPSPEGTVRQATLPQPQTGRERRGEEEDREEEQWPATGGVDRAMQSSEIHMLQEWQEAYLREEGVFTDSQKSRAISGGKKSRAVCFLCVIELLLCP